MHNDIPLIYGKPGKVPKLRRKKEKETTLHPETHEMT